MKDELKREYEIRERKSNSSSVAITLLIGEIDHFNGLIDEIVDNMNEIITDGKSDKKAIEETKNIMKKFEDKKQERLKKMEGTM